MSNKTSSSFENAVSEFFQNYEETAWSDNVPKFDFELALQCGLYVQDHYDESGFSGGALVKVENGQFFVHANANWNAFSKGQELPAVLAVPVQSSERSEFPELSKNTDTGIPVIVVFEDFFVNSKRLRFANFSLKRVSELFVKDLGFVEQVFKKRKEIFDLLPRNSELGKD